MTRFINFLFLFFIVLHVYSQNKQNPKQYSSQNCKIRSLQIADEISDNYFFVNKKPAYDSLNKKLDNWEKNCGLTEPILRLRILNQIQYGLNTDSLLNLYFNSDFHNLYKSIQNPTDSIENNSIAYGFVPFEHPYNEMTSIIAQELANKNISTNEFLFCKLYFDDLNAFTISKNTKNSSLKNNSYPNSINDENIVSFGTKISVGVWNPNTIKSTNFEPGPYLGIAMGGIHSQWHFDFEAKARLHSDFYFDFSAFDEIYEVKSTFAMFLGCKYGHQVFKLGPVKAFIVGGLGADITDTDLVKEVIYDEETDQYHDRYFYLGAMHLSIGFEIFIEDENKMQFGLESNAHFYSYEANSRLKSNIPSSAVSTGIFFRF